MTIVFAAKKNIYFCRRNHITQLTLFKLNDQQTFIKN